MISNLVIWETKRHPPAIRYALMSVVFYTRRSEIIDGLIELLIQMIHRLSVGISLSPLTEQADPSSNNKVKGQIQTGWSMTSLLDILKEAEMRIGFTDCFKTQRSSERFDRDELQRRLLLALYGLATNTGLKSISAGRHGVSYKDLLHTRKFYIYKAALREAISKVSNAIFKIRNPVIWEEGTTACASDSKV